MPIRYKVVKTKTRCSAIIDGKSLYALKYIPGTTVTAKSGTLGIMTFERKFQAEDFAWHLNTLGIYDNFIVIKVQGIGRGSYPYEICGRFRTDDLHHFYKNDSWFSKNSPPDGTMCYKSVEVLE